MRPPSGALTLALLGDVPASRARAAAIATAALPLLALLAAWWAFDADGPEPFQLVAEAPWIPALGVAWRVGVDGMSLALTLMSAVVFVAAIAWPMESEDRPRAYYAWFLFLEAVSLGLFLTLDLLLFYVFFDLSLVGMFFLIGRWGHGDAPGRGAQVLRLHLRRERSRSCSPSSSSCWPCPRAQLRHARPDRGPAARGRRASRRRWCSWASSSASRSRRRSSPSTPGCRRRMSTRRDAASAVLAGVLLKMGTYGMVRVPLQMMRETFADWALALAVFALISILWGALVALGQSNLKRRIAYTSVNHMGYAVLGIAVAGSTVAGQEGARALALTGRGDRDGRARPHHRRAVPSRGRHLGAGGDLRDRLASVASREGRRA